MRFASDTTGDAEHHSLREFAQGGRHVSGHAYPTQLEFHGKRQIARWRPLSSRFTAPEQLSRWQPLVTWLLVVPQHLMLSGLSILRSSSS